MRARHSPRHGEGRGAAEGIGLSEGSEETFRSRLFDELSEWFPEDALAPLASAGGGASELAFADRAVRQLLPLALDASALGAAAQVVRALAPAVDDASVRRMMFSLEKVARAHAAPELLIRAAHGVCACALSSVLAEARGPDAVERAQRQLVSALVRLATTAVKTGVPVDAVVKCLASA